MKLIFICHIYYIGSIYILGLLRHAQILSKVHPRYFQNDDFAFCMAKINASMKKGFRIRVDINRSNLIIQNMS